MSVQRKTDNLIIIFVWKEVYVVGQVDADSSGKSDDFESDNVKRRDRRGYNLNPKRFSSLYKQYINTVSCSKEP